MTKERKIKIALCWCFVAVCMIIIFYYSSQVASVSSETSEGWITRILKTFGINLSTHFIRKTAHALEFFGLCFAFNLAYRFTFGYFCPLVSFLSTMFYASTDEIHQLFVEGRACRAYDLFVDGCGAAVMTLFMIIVILIDYKRSKSWLY